MQQGKAMQKDQRRMNNSSSLRTVVAQMVKDGFVAVVGVIRVRSSHSPFAASEIVHGSVQVVRGLQVEHGEDRDRTNYLLELQRNNMKTMAGRQQFPQTDGT